MEEEKKREEPNYFMSYENDKWVLNIRDPITKEVIEKRVADGSGRWGPMRNQASVATRRRR